MQIIVWQTRTLLPSTLPQSLFRLTFGDMGSSDVGDCDHAFNLVLKEYTHPIEVQVSFRLRRSQRALIMRGATVHFRPTRV